MTKMEQGRVLGKVWREEREGKIMQLYYNLSFLKIMTLGMEVLRAFKKDRASPDQ